MAGVTQIAVEIDDESLAQIDSLVAARYRSRAEVIRLAVHEWLGRRREEEVDAALERGYAVSSARDEERAWAKVSVEGLRVADLDW